MTRNPEKLDKLSQDQYESWLEKFLKSDADIVEKILKLKELVVMYTKRVGEKEGNELYGAETRVHLQKAIATVESMYQLGKDTKNWELQKVATSMGICLTEMVKTMYDPLSKLSGKKDENVAAHDWMYI